MSSIALRNIEVSYTKKVFNKFEFNLNFTWEVFVNMLNIIMMTQAGYTNGIGRALSRFGFL